MWGRNWVWRWVAREWGEWDGSGPRKNGFKAKRGKKGILRENGPFFLVIFLLRISKFIDDFFPSISHI